MARIFTDKEGMARSWTKDTVSRSRIQYGPKLRKKFHRNPLSGDVGIRQASAKAMTSVDRQGPRITYLGKHAVEETTPIAATRFEAPGPLHKEKQLRYSLARRGVRRDVRPYSGY